MISVLCVLVFKLFISLASFTLQAPWINWMTTFPDKDSYKSRRLVIFKTQVSGYLVSEVGCQVNLLLFHTAHLLESIFMVSSTDMTFWYSSEFKYPRLHLQYIANQFQFSSTNFWQISNIVVCVNYLDQIFFKLLFFLYLICSIWYGPHSREVQKLEDKIPGHMTSAHIQISF